MCKEVDTYIVVDIEASGPNPSNYSMLAVGACTLVPPRATFYVELQPDREAYTREALEVAGLSLARLATDGAAPATAMQQFADWVKGVVPEGGRPVLTALNAPFDWMFVNDYFHRYLGYNPFGHAALDIKAYYMGMFGVGWRETSYSQIRCRLLADKPLAHNALQDAVDEADLFGAMLARRQHSDVGQGDQEGAEW